MANYKRKYLKDKKDTKRLIRKLKRQAVNLKEFDKFFVDNGIMRIHCRLISRSCKYYRIRADYRTVRNLKNNYTRKRWKKSKAYRLRYFN